MIRIEYARKRGENRLYVTGHAGYAEHGQDIVCAGVSGITYALCGWLCKHVQGAEISLGEGKTFILTRQNANIDTAFEVALSGYSLIAAKYPEHVSLTID